MEELFIALGDQFSGIRTLRTDGKICLYCVDVAFGDFCYPGTTLIKALENAVNNMPK